MNSGRLVFLGSIRAHGSIWGSIVHLGSPEPKSSPVWRTTARSCITANTGTYHCPRMSAGPPWTAHQRAQAAISRPTGRDQLSDRALSGGQVLPCEYTPAGAHAQATASRAFRSLGDIRPFFGFTRIYDWARCRRATEGVLLVPAKLLPQAAGVCPGRGYG